MQCDKTEKSADSEVLAAARRGEPLSEAQALRVLGWPNNDLDRLLDVTRIVRQRYFGLRVECCGIVNARSGRCSEDCRFCAQSAHNAVASVETYPLSDSMALLSARSNFPQGLRGRFGIVTSGGALVADECEQIERLIAEHSDDRVAWCASLGMLDEAALQRLKAAGLRRYHHNIETAESHFSNICSTHTYAQRVATVKAAQRVGLEVCCGALFGLGESHLQRVELALALRELSVDAIPINFLVPVPGTPLAATPPCFSQEDVLRLVAMMRLVNPETPLRLCGGRERYLFEKMGRAFDAGATGIMVGGYLTLRGRPVSMDLEMISAAGYEPESGEP